MPDADLDLLIAAAERAGDTALQFAGKTTRHWDKPDGAGPVTEADYAVNDVLAAELRGARADYGWLSEESEDDAARLSKPTVFIVDPIDGTRSFLEGAKTWAHALAIARDGIVTAAVIYLPMCERMYTAATGQPAQLNGVPIAPSDCGQLDGAAVLAARPTMAREHWVGPVPNVDRQYRPSLAYRMASVAEGRFDGMVTLRPTWEWDAAAGDLILRQSGARCSDRSGASLRFNNRHPAVNGIVAGGPALHGAMIDGLAPL